MPMPIRPATPLTDKWWAVAGAGTPDWNDGGSEPISQAHLGLSRWFGPNATEPVPDDIAPLAPEYFAVDAYLKAAASYLANPDPVPLVVVSDVSPVIVTTPHTPEQHAEAAQLVGQVDQHIPPHARHWWEKLLALFGHHAG